MNYDTVVAEHWANCIQIPGYAWERTLKRTELLDMFCYHISLSPKRDGQREHMLIKELKLLHSGYPEFNFIFIEKNNSILL